MGRCSVHRDDETEVARVDRDDRPVEELLQPEPVAWLQGCLPRLDHEFERRRLVRTGADRVDMAVGGIPRDRLDLGLAGDHVGNLAGQGHQRLAELLRSERDRKLGEPGHRAKMRGGVGG